MPKILLWVVWDCQTLQCVSALSDELKQLLVVYFGEMDLFENWVRNINGHYWSLEILDGEVF